MIYSDPADDGFARGDVFPNGPFRPASSLQRGSVQFLSLGPGDPSTPNGPSIKGAKRLPFAIDKGFPLDQAAHPSATYLGEMTVQQWEKETGLVREDYFASIPSLPLSYESARPILEGLGGPNVPAGWQGGLPIPYHVGPGPLEVSFGVAMDYKLRTIWNVIATIKGDVEPERWVMIGNHRDAWVYGAVDPSSGTAATLETCRALGSAVKQGWKPRRTLVYSSWDAEEYGLVGSTEWADLHKEEVTEKAVMMLNVDSAVSGHETSIFDGVPSLRDLGTRSDRRIGDRRAFGQAAPSQVWIDKTTRRNGRTRLRPSISPDLWDMPVRRPRRSRPAAQVLVPHDGSRSARARTTPSFLDHLGVPAIDAGFSGRYGVYHSVYDNFTWMEKGGRSRVHHPRDGGQVLYRARQCVPAAADVVPLKFVPYGEALRDYVGRPAANGGTQGPGLKEADAAKPR